MTALSFADECADLSLTLLRLKVGLLELRRNLARRQVRGISAKYRPDQPRVPAGNPEGGQWTDGSGGSGPMSFEEWLAGGWASGLGAFDADLTTGDGSSDWKLPNDDTEVDWANGRMRGGGSNWSNATPGQHARWAASELEAQAAIRRVQEIDPRWRPPASMSEGIEGAILSNQAVVRQAEARLREFQGMGFLNGPFAHGSIPAPIRRRLNDEEQSEINHLGRVFGCHTCGSTEPRTRNGNFIGDHQKPTSINPPGANQQLYPHCGSCSAKQGGFLSNFLRKR
jgi:hypothetical protein